MKKRYPILLAVIIGLLSAVNLHADPFELVLRGKLNPDISSPTGMADACDIGGADFLLRFTGNTDEQAGFIDNLGTPQVINRYFQPDGFSADLEITNRPNGQPDIIINVVSIWT
jgi:hypothetical protein